MLLLLSACHLFSSGAIPCTEDEPCDSEADTDTDADADTDSDADADADADTDADSDADADPVTGAVVTASNGSSWGITTFRPDGAVDVELTGTGATYGPVVWVESLRVGAAASGSDLYEVTEAAVTQFDTVESPVRDLAFHDDLLYVLSGSDVYAYDEGASALVGEFTDARHLVESPDGVYVIEVDGNAPTLLLISGGSTSVVLADYDTITGRSHAAFLGPGDTVWTCSEGGGVWSIDDIAAGLTTPSRLAQGSLTDVVDCGYDDATDEVLMFSATRGVHRVRADSTTTEWVTEPSALPIVRGAPVR